MKTSDRYLFLLLVFLVCSNLLWYFCGHTPLYWDSAGHLSYSIDFFNSLSSSDNSSVIKKFLNASWYYPPVVYWSSLPFQYIFGRGELAGFIQMTFFLMLLVFCVKKIGEKLYNEETGLFAAFCISMFPIVSLYSREYMLDLPLAAMCAAAVLCVLRAKKFSNTANSILSGLILGLGMLTKWTFVLFVIIPLLYYFITGMKTNKKLKVILNFLLSLIIAFIVSAPWYIKNIISIFSNRLNELGRETVGASEFFFYYLKIIPEQISLVMTILIITGVILYWKKRNYLFYKMPLYWFASGYILITLITFKLPRFSIPLLITLSIMFASLIFAQRQEKYAKNLFIKIFIAVSFLNFIFFSFLSPRNELNLPLTGTPLFANVTPDKNNRHCEDMIKDINNDRVSGGKPKVMVRVIPRKENFNNAVLEYYAKLNNAPVYFSDEQNFPNLTDYIIIQNDTAQDITPKAKEIIKELLSNSGIYSGTFKELKSYIMPDGSEVKIFKINQSPVKIETDSLKTLIKYTAEKFFREKLQTKGRFDCSVSIVDSNELSQGKLSSIKFFCEETNFPKTAWRSLQFMEDDPEIFINVIKLRDFELELKDAEFDLSALLKNGTLNILSLREINVISFEITRENLQEYIRISTATKLTTTDSVFFTGSTINIKWRTAEGHRDEVSLKLYQNDNTNIYFAIEKFHMYNVSLPPWLADYMLEKYNPLIKGIDFTDSFKMGSLKFDKDKITIGR